MATLLKILFLAAITGLIACLPAIIPPLPLPVTTASPTDDPFPQPPLPDHPTELELGRYLFWRHCMTCHGDRGQGLTAEFRTRWVSDHQDCWGRGCHSGRYANDAFPVPTAVPPLVRADRLSRFDSLQSLAAFLRTTHPPQAPGSLTDAEYRTLAAYLFTVNGRSSNSNPGPTANLPFDQPPTTTGSSNISIAGLMILGLLLAAIAFTQINHIRQSR